MSGASPDFIESLCIAEDAEDEVCSYIAAK